MRFIIDDTEIDLLAIGDFTQHETLLMAKAGMGLQTWARTMGQLDRLALAEDGENVVVLGDAEYQADPTRCSREYMFDSPRHLLAVIIATWLARRHAGQPNLSFEQSAQVSWSRFERVPEDDIEEDDDANDGESPDPTQAPASEAAGG